MRADKRMLFEFPIPPSNVKASSNSASSDLVEEEPVNLHLFRDHLLSKSHVCQELQNCNPIPWQIYVLDNSFYTP
jgi:hypothetical protein